jgi:hypothetical protein
MVIGEGFAWAHLPKTGGEATAAMFKLFPDLIEFADPQDTNDKHDPFFKRKELIRGKLLVMNFRRLPSWVLSRAQHTARKGNWPDYVPQPMPTPEELAASSFPDNRVLLYTSDGRFYPDRWLRMETLSDDFLDLVSDFRPVTAEERRRVQELGGVNAAQYDHELAKWFSPDQVRRMYLNNPCWATIEQELYGELYLAEEPAAAGGRSRPGEDTLR